MLASDAILRISRGFRSIYTFSGKQENDDSIKILIFISEASCGDSKIEFSKGLYVGVKEESLNLRVSIVTLIGQ